MTGFLKKKNSSTMKVFDGVADGMKAKTKMRFYGNYMFYLLYSSFIWP